ncbi:MAG: FlgO family outer membrane protein [Arcobacteraceae bacterium]|nr:FlgO family outer membrane protein [Arcobacteraceae bacterium]
MKLSLLLVIFLTFFVSGCTDKFNIFNLKKTEKIEPTPTYAPNKEIKTNINDLIDDLCDQLLANHLSLDTNNILVTSFVDLNQLNSSSDFGRLLSENMISKLHMKGFRVKEYRGQSAISINAQGEFHITRDIKKLPDEIEASYVLIGTYSAINENLSSINVRIIDFSNGDIYATASSIYAFNNIKKTDAKQKKYVDIVRDK